MLNIKINIKIIHQVSKFESRLPTDPFWFVLNKDLAQNRVLSNLVGYDEIRPDDFNDCVVGQNPRQ